MSNSSSNHWFNQRFSAVVFAGLSLCVGPMMYKLCQGSFQYAIKTLSSPFKMAMFTLWLSLMMYHAYLGLEVIFEDYIHTVLLRKVLLGIIKVAALFFLGLILFSFMSIYHLHKVYIP